MPTDSARARRSWMRRWTCSPRRAFSAPASATSPRPSGVRESALYNYFPSKDALFEALILADQHSKVERLASLAEERITDVQAFLEQLVLEALQSFAEPRQQQLFRIMMSDGIRLARDGRINLFERLGDRRERMEVIMRRLIREGWLRAADPQMLAMSFAAPLFMCRHLEAIDADLPLIHKPAEFARQHVEQFLRGASAAIVRPKAAPRGGRQTTTAGGTPHAPHASTPMTIMTIPVAAPSRRPLDRRPVRRAAGQCVHSRHRRVGGARRGCGRLRHPRHGGRAARHPLHPGERHADRGGGRRRGRRDCRPRHRHPGRARHPREQRRRPRAHRRGRGRGAGPGGAGQRRADRGPARDCQRRRLRRRAGAGSGERQGHARPRRSPTSSA